jgi:microcin C transport system substrate-binding protein
MNKATTMQGIIDTSRALDRIFIAEHYAVPYQYRPNTMIAYWNHFGMPATLPKYYSVEDGLNYLMTWPLDTWWEKDLR